jgi:hypothetical protein
VAFSPQYIIRRLLSIRDFDELKYVLWGAKKMLGHVKDFMVNPKKTESYKQIQG